MAEKTGSRAALTGWSSLPFLVLLVAWPTPGAGQDGYVGGRAGASFATIGGEDPDSADAHRTGVVLGALTGCRLTERVSLETEMTWIQKGGEGMVQGFEEPLGFALVDDLQVPFLARLTLPGPGARAPTILTGGRATVELDCDVRTPPKELAVTLGCDESSSFDTRRNGGLEPGRGSRRSLQRCERALLVEGRYERGLRTLERPPDALDRRRRGLALTLGAAVAP